MSKFSVETDTIKHSASLLGDAAESLSYYGRAISDVQSALAFSPSIQSGVGGALSTLSQRASNQAGTLEAFSGGLSKIADEYRTAEGNVIHNIGGYTSLFDMLIHHLPQYIISGGGLYPVISGLLLFDDAVSWWNWKARDTGWEISPKHEGELDLIDHFKKDTEKGEEGNFLNKIDDFNDKHKKEKSKKGYLEKGEDGKLHAVSLDPDDNEANNEFDDRFKGPIDTDVKIAGVEAAAGGALWALKGGDGNEGLLAGDKDGTHASLELEAGKWDANAGAYIGPGGAGVYAGASVTALSLAAEAQLGDDNLGVYGKGSVDVLKAEVSGDISAGLYDKDGNFNPNVHAGVNAEAVLVEAKGTAGGKILGTDVSLTGGVKVGVGAHADVGFQDGKFSFDIGASLGVGFSVAGEIDFSGTINAVADAASSAVDWLSGLIH